MRFNKSIFTLFIILIAHLSTLGQFGMIYVSSGTEYSIESDQAMGDNYVTHRDLPQGYFVAKGTAKFLGASDSRNINGYMKHIPNEANQAYTFEVGNGTELRQLSVSGSRPSNLTIGVAWISGDPSVTGDPTNDKVFHSRDAKGTGITDVSSVGQWDWVDFGTNNMGAGGITVTVSIPNLTGFSAANGLRLIGWNGSQWINLSGTSGATGSAENSKLTGTIPSGVVIQAIGIGKVQDEADLILTKTIQSANVFVGNNATFTLTVKNNGPSNATNIRVQDMLPGGLTFVSVNSNINWDGVNSIWTIPTLANGASETLTIVAKVDNSAKTTIVNTARILSLTQVDPNLANNESSVTVNPQYMGISLVKSGVYSSGTPERIEYVFTIKNTGNVPLTDLVLNDPKLNGNLGLNNTSLAAGASMTHRQWYTLNQDEINAGSVSNSATISGSGPNNITTTDISGTSEDNNNPTVTSLTQSPKMGLVLSKSVYNSDKDVIVYTYVLRNLGNVTLSDVKIEDEKTSDNLIPLDTRIAPGDSMLVSFEYKPTQAEKDSGRVLNSGKALGTDPKGNTIEELLSSEIQYTLIPLNALISLVKEGVYVPATNTVKYTFTIENTGSLTIRNLVLRDSKISSSPLGIEATEIAPNQKITTIVNYSPSELERSTGEVVNQANIEGVDLQGRPVSDQSGVTANDDLPTTTPIIGAGNAEITIVKTTGAYDVTAGTLVYNFVIRNRGQVVLTDIELRDSKISEKPLVLSRTSLAPGDSLKITEIYTLTPEEKTNRRVENQATITALDPAKRVVTDLSGTTESNDEKTIYVLQCIPDLTPILAVTPTSNISGSRDMIIEIRVRELNGCVTDGSRVRVVLSQMSNFTFTWSSYSNITSLPEANLTNLENANWTFSTSGSSYNWDYKLGSFNAFKISRFAFKGRWTSGYTAGNTMFRLQLISGSGGEQNSINNADTELVRWTSRSL